MRPPGLCLLLLLVPCGLSAAVMMNIEPRLAFVGEVVAVRCELPQDITYDVARIHHDDTVFLSALRLPKSCATGEPAPLVRSTFAKVVREKNATRTSVVIKFVAQVSNSGMYVCRFISGLSEYTSTAQQLVVGEAALVQELVVRPKHGEQLIGGRRMRVDCVGTLGVPPGKLWIEDGENRTLPVESEQVTNPNGEVLTKISARMLAPMNKNNESFTCHGRNVFTTNRTDTQVIDEMNERVVVYHTPNHLVISPAVDEARNGDVFVCHGKGLPKPMYKWVVNTSGVIETVHSDTLRVNVTGDSILTCVAVNHIGGDAFSGRRNLWLNSKNGSHGEVFVVHRNKTNFLLDDQPPLATTAEPTTVKPTTMEPTTAEPTTAEPTTAEPTTVKKTTAEQTTAEPTTVKKTTAEPTTAEPTTAEPTTAEPTTVEPTMVKKTLVKETMVNQTTEEPIVAETEDWRRNSSRRLVTPQPRRSAEERHYDTLLFYLKVSLAANVIFGSLLLIFLIGVCVKLGSLAAK